MPIPKMKIPQPTAAKLNRNSFVTPQRRQESDQQEGLRAEQQPCDAGNSYYAHAGNFHKREAGDDNHNANPYDVRHMDCYNNINNSQANSLKNPAGRPGKLGRMHQKQSNSQNPMHSRDSQLSAKQATERVDNRGQKLVVQTKFKNNNDEDDPYDKNRFHHTQNMSASKKKGQNDYNEASSVEISDRISQNNGGHRQKKIPPKTLKNASIIKQTETKENVSVFGAFTKKYTNSHGGSIFSRRGSSAIHSESSPMIKGVKSQKLEEDQTPRHSSQLTIKKRSYLAGISNSAKALPDDSINMQASSQKNDFFDKQFVQVLKGELFKGLDHKVGGYFFKRRDHRQGFIKGFLQNYLGIIYDRRYFQIDMENLTFKYAKDLASIDEPGVYEEKLRNLKSVKKNVVSMPVIQNGQEVLVQKDVFDLGQQIDRGPNSRTQNVFELQTSNRLFTLYSDDYDFLCQFVLHLEKVIKLKDELFELQNKKDKQMEEVHKQFQRTQDRKFERSSLSRGRATADQMDTYHYNSGAMAANQNTGGPTPSFNSGSVSDLHMNSSLIAQKNNQNALSSLRGTATNNFNLTIPKPPRAAPKQTKEYTQRTAQGTQQNFLRADDKICFNSIQKVSSLQFQATKINDQGSPSTPLSDQCKILSRRVNFSAMKSDEKALEADQDVDQIEPSKLHNFAINNNNDDGSRQSKESDMFDDDSFDRQSKSIKETESRSKQKRNHVIILESVESASGQRVNIQDISNLSAIQRKIPVIKQSQITLADQQQAGHDKILVQQTIGSGNYQITDAQNNQNLQLEVAQQQLSEEPKKTTENNFFDIVESTQKKNDEAKNATQATKQSCTDIIESYHQTTSSHLAIHKSATLQVPKTQQKLKKKGTLISDALDKLASPNLNKRALSKLLNNDQGVTFGNKDFAVSRQSSLKQSQIEASDSGTYKNCSSGVISAQRSKRYNTENIELIKEHVERRKRKISASNLAAVIDSQNSSQKSPKKSSYSNNSPHIKQINKQLHEKTRNITDMITGKNIEEFQVIYRSSTKKSMSRNSASDQELFDTSEAVWGQLKSKDNFDKQSESSAAQTVNKGNQNNNRSSDVGSVNSKSHPKKSQYSQRRRHQQRQNQNNMNLKDQAYQINQQMIEQQLKNMQYRTSSAPHDSQKAPNFPKNKTEWSSNRLAGDNQHTGQQPTDGQMNYGMASQPQQNIQIIQQNYNFFYPNEQSALEAQSMLAYQQLSYQHTQGYVSNEGHLQNQQPASQVQPPSHTKFRDNKSSVQQSNFMGQQIPNQMRYQNIHDKDSDIQVSRVQKNNQDAPKPTDHNQGPKDSTISHQKPLNNKLKNKQTVEPTTHQSNSLDKKFSKSYDPKFLLLQFKKNSCNKAKGSVTSLNQDNSVNQSALPTVSKASIGLLNLASQNSHADSKSNLKFSTPMQLNEPSKSRKIKISLSKNKINSQGSQLKIQNQNSDMIIDPKLRQIPYSPFSGANPLIQQVNQKYVNDRKNLINQYQIKEQNEHDQAGQKRALHSMTDLKKLSNDQPDQVRFRQRNNQNILSVKKDGAIIQMPEDDINWFEVDSSYQTHNPHDQSNSQATAYEQNETQNLLSKQQTKNLRINKIMIKSQKSNMEAVALNKNDQLLENNGGTAAAGQIGLEQQQMEPISISLGNISQNKQYPTRNKINLSVSEQLPQQKPQIQQVVIQEEIESQLNEFQGQKHSKKKIKISEHSLIRIKNHLKQSNSSLEPTDQYQSSKPNEI